MSSLVKSFFELLFETFGMLNKPIFEAHTNGVYKELQVMRRPPPLPEIIRFTHIKKVGMSTINCADYNLLASMDGSKISANMKLL